VREFSEYFVNNRWIAAGGATYLDIDSPLDETVVARVRCCSAADLDRAVEAARNGTRIWAMSTLAERRAALERFATALRSREGALIAALAEDIGAPVSLSRALHLPMPLRNLELIATGLDEIRWEEAIGNACVVREPVGVVAAITPWNAPVHQIIAKLAGAIGAGCATVLKPSELAPTVAQLVVDAVAETGLPDGVVNMVWGGPAVGQQLVEHSGVDMVSFTGSEGVGREIMRTAAAGLKRLSLELGGKSAAVLLDDADFALAVPAVVRQCMANSGQTCVSQSRMLVPAKRIAEAEALACETATGLRLGDPRAPDTQVGPVRSRAQLQRIAAIVREAIDGGARCVCGGLGRPAGRTSGYFMAPTILTDVQPELAVAQRELFGPVLAIIAYATDDEALAIANGTAYGLSAGVWSADTRRARRTAAQIRAGQVIINGAAQNLAAPFGGFGRSGFGRENGRFSVEAFLEFKSLQGSA